MEEQTVRGEVPEHHYFAMVPFMVIDDLGPYEGWLYVSYKRVVTEDPNRSVWKSMKTLSKETGISERQLYDARDELERRGLIRVTKRSGQTTIITLRDIWDINYQRYRSQAEFESGEPLHVMQTPSAPGADKEDIDKKIKYIEPSGSVYSLTPTIVAKRDQLHSNLENPLSSKVDYEHYPTIMEALVPILQKNGVKISLSVNQLAELTKEVATPVGKFPGPQDEYDRYPTSFHEFLRELPKTTTWQKRFTEGRKRLTTGTLIEMIRGYHWKGGWLEYRPKESTTETASTNTGDWDI